MTLKLGILISGGGTTFVNLHDKIEAGELDAEIVCVISSKSKAAGLDKARDRGYPTVFMGRRKFDSDETYSEAITAVLQEQGADLVLLAGFLRKYLPGEAYADRCLNIHPSLIPAFSGHGFYGMKVHEAVKRRGCKVSGCTVHLVNEHYDEGPILIQKVTRIEESDTPEDIARKVFVLECEAYPEAVRLFLDR